MSEIFLCKNKIVLSLGHLGVNIEVTYYNFLHIIVTIIVISNLNNTYSEHLRLVLTDELVAKENGEYLLWQNL